MILTVMFEGISKEATVLSVLLKVRTNPYHDRGYLYVVLVLQSCSDSLHILPSTSSDTYVASSDCACHIGNMEIEEDLDMQEDEEEEVNVKTQKGVGSEEEECIGVKDEEGLYSGEEEEEEEDGIDIKEEEVEDGIDIKEEEVEDVIIKEEECVDIKEEVSLEGTV